MKNVLFLIRIHKHRIKIPFRVRNFLLDYYRILPLRVQRIIYNLINK